MNTRWNNAQEPQKMYKKMFDPTLARYIIAGKIAEKVLPYKDGEYAEFDDDGQAVHAKLNQDEWRKKCISLFMWDVDLLG